MVSPPAPAGWPNQPARGIPPLAGYTVALATERRRPALAAVLESAGARVVAVQTVRVLSQPDEAALRAATLACLAAPIDELVVSSAFGFRSWMKAAQSWHLADALVAAFGVARLLARDARCADSLRDIGLYEIWSTAAASTEELLRYLLAQDLAGRRVVVQLDSPSLQDLCRSVRERGADVVAVPTYRTLPPNYSDPLRRLVDQIVRRQVDAVALTDPVTTENLLRQADREERGADLLNALCEEVMVVCLGPLTAAALQASGLRPLVGREGYVEDIAATLLARLPTSAVRLALGRHQIEVRGQAVVVDERLIPVQSVPIAVLRTLARNPGRVMSCAEIRRGMPTGAGIDDHAVEMAVSRLRRSLNGTDVIQTVMRRGYRLAV
ncbi:MAG TPA: uroporphyrinogen-III synthase [Pilimelia sp.]|nr:uroporphyrinogen-III synthase [Pilimelia sp.]